MNNFKDIHCPHFLLCSGCTIDENVDHPPLLDEVKNYFGQLSIPFSYYSDLVTGWRCRGKLAVRGSWQQPSLGLYEAGTHEVVDIPSCRVHHPSINQAMEEVKKWMKLEKIIPYNEQSYQGVLRYIQCVVERSSGRVQLTLVLNTAQLNNLPIHSLWEQNSALWHSLWVNYNQQHTNVIFGQNWELIKGQEYLWENLADTAVCFHPANFAQANLNVFERLLKDLKEKIFPGKKIIEYYAGVGVIGLTLAQKAKEVICCEINPYAEKAFEKARSCQSSAILSFRKGAVVEHIHLLKEADIAIVDPPRKGLDQALLKALLEDNSLSSLWYMSCGWPSFKRDCDALLKNWRLSHAKAYLFFPGTNHLEILAHFEKNPN